MNFLLVYWLWALVPLLVLAIRFWQKGLFRRNRQTGWLLASGICLVLALAGPYWSLKPSARIVRVMDLLVVLDVSQSMFCLDGTPRRIDVARNFLRNLLPQFSGRSAGLILFAGSAEIAAPFTSDLQSILVLLESITPGMIPQPGTNSENIRFRMEEILESPENKHILVLFLSDGEFFDSVTGLEKWFRENPRTTLMTFACGRKKMPVPEYNLKKLHPQAESTPDPGRLAELARAADGFFFDLSRENPLDLERKVMQNVQEIITTGRKIPQDRSREFLILGLIFLLLYQFPYVPVRQHTLARAAVLILIISTVSMKPEEEYQKLFQQALKDMQAKKLDQALVRLQKLQQQTGAEEVDVAVGNGYLMKGNYEEAIRSYKKVIAKNPWNQIARWNWEVALKRQKLSEQSDHQNKPAPSPPEPKRLRPESEALLNYFEQKEQQQIQHENEQKNYTHQFKW